MNASHGLLSVHSFSQPFGVFIFYPLELFCPSFSHLFNAAYVGKVIHLIYDYIYGMNWFLYVLFLHSLLYAMNKKCTNALSDWLFNKMQNFRWA